MTELFLRFCRVSGPLSKLRNERRYARKAVHSFSGPAVPGAEKNEVPAWGEYDSALASIGDRLGRAGYLTASERQRAVLVGAMLCASAVGTGVFLSLRDSPVVVGAVTIGAMYGAFCLLVVVLRARAREVERSILFELPVFMEGLVLLVESGYGLLPALEQVLVRQDVTPGKKSVLCRIMNLTYRISVSGIPFSDALEMVSQAIPYRVLRHVLLHLDMSATEGAELVPSLRSLSDHTHLEWRLSVEQRVRRLENWVVFPVFGAVLGLLLLLAAVPLVPLLEVSRTLRESRGSVAVESGGMFSPASNEGSSMFRPPVLWADRHIRCSDHGCDERGEGK